MQPGRSLGKPPKIIKPGTRGPGFIGRSSDPKIGLLSEEEAEKITKHV
jgi:hypothetical protein